MTNAEKYKEVFGFLPYATSCPTEDCKFCPAKPCDSYKWWNEEYKENKE